MNGDLRISVALVTRNRPEPLRRCLSSLRAQKLQPFEVVVSDDSGEGFAPETRRIAQEFGCRYVVGPGRGLYANRNFAALQCAGTHVRTMDDDHTFPEGHFALCMEAVRSNPYAIWTTGEVSFVDGEYYGKAETATQLHPSGMGGPVGNPDDNWAVSDGSTIYPRSVFDRGMRMVEEFGYGSSYLEFGALLYRSGFRSRCIPGALVEHHAGRATIERGRSSGEVASWMFGSLCFNLHFKPNAALAMKYAAANLLHSKRPLALLAALPGMITRVRERWTASP
jgi:glycosyltransferase involved in cell wall biosynthesis